MSARSVPEWIGATPDTPAPPRVRVRVFEAYGGRCYLSGRKIMAGDKWDLEHVLALINGGENRESNLAPALKDAHREKTADDMAVKSKTARQRLKHLGQWPKSPFKLKGRGFPKRAAVAGRLAEDAAADDATGASATGGIALPQQRNDP